MPGETMHRGYREVRPTAPSNYALPGPIAHTASKNIQIEIADQLAANPWTRQTAPVRLTTQGVRLPYWTLNRHSDAAAQPGRLPRLHNERSA